MSVSVSITRTRFPPEPNGYLHIGHLKAMLKNFKTGSTTCILRFDDTNPETEKQMYVDAAIEDVEWLGFKPSKITYTSDYFDQLYDYAIDLIKLDLAYIDSTPAKEMAEMRYNGIATKDRNRPIEESLTLFNEMKEGKYANGQYVLRLKIKHDHNNTSMRDPIAYRIKHSSHYRTKDKWCIYPSYDFSHSLVDSIEKIDWSYCTREFFIRRDQYFWTLDQLKLHRPQVLEFNRLVISDVLLSKRKILAKISDLSDPVNSFDDPSLFTISGLRNRGFPPEALIHFCENYVSYVEGEGGVIPKHKFDHSVREYFNSVCKRRFGIVNPIQLSVLSQDKIIIRPDNFDPHSLIGREIHIPNNPVLLIEKTDFKLDPEKKYKRLAPGKEVRLKYYSIIKYKDHDINGIIAEALEKNKTKGAAIQWLYKADAVEMNCIDPDTSNTYTVLVESTVPCMHGQVIQFERLGYYKVLNDTTLMKVVSLKNGYHT